MARRMAMVGLLMLAGAWAGTACAQPGGAPAPAESWINAVSIEPQKAGGAVLRIEASASVRFTTFRLAQTPEKPERLVVDLQDARWREGYAEQHIGENGVIGWRASLFADKPPVTRVVVDLLRSVTFRVATASPAQSIRIEIGEVDPPSEEPNGGSTGPATPPDGPGTPTGPTPGGTTDTPPPAGPEFRPEQSLHLTKVELLASDAEHIEYRIVLDGPSDPLAFLFASPALFVLDFPSAAPAATKGVASGWVELDRGSSPAVRHVRLCETPEGQVLSSRLVMELDSPVPYDLSPDPSTRNAWKLSLRFAPSYQGLVVVDPGHGGSEAGARGIGGLEEEDLNLQLALRLRAELMRRGIAAILTRTANTTSPVYHRPYVGNELSADLFLSIHNNIGSPREGGTETYYYHESGKAFAQTIQKALVAALGRPDRRAKFGDLAVTRDSTIPAALAEVVFLDCPDETKLIVQEAFQNKVVLALAGAIEETLRAKRAGTPAQP